MAKDKISDYSSTANSNTDIAGINIDEGCAPSGINDAIRTLMAQLKTWQSGGQDVYIHPAGSASAPSITANGDTNTGIFFPAADTIAWTTGGTERLRLNSSGNLGLGVTPSAWESSYQVFDIGTNGTVYNYANGAMVVANNLYVTGGVFKYKISSYAPSLYAQSSGQHIWYYAASGTAGNTATLTQAMTLDASGNLIVGGTTAVNSASGRGNITINGSSSAILNFTVGGTWYGHVYHDGTNLEMYNNRAGANIFYTNGSERARIDSSGNLLVGRTSGVASEKFSVLQSASDWVGQFVNSYSGTYYGIRINSSSTQNNTSSLLYDGLDNGNLRFRVYSNGGIANYSANNSNLSDSREKKDVELAGNYLAKICAIPVKTFLYNDQTDTDKNLGVIAQDVQSVAPELVAETNWGSEEEPKMRLSIYQTDLQYALMKCIQEQQAIIETLTARITALEQA